MKVKVYTLSSHILIGIWSSSAVSMMDFLLQNSYPVASSCHGDAVCGKCRLSVLDTEHVLEIENKDESILREREALKPSERIACQTYLRADLQGEYSLFVNATYWAQ